MAYPALPKLLIFCLVVVLFNLGPYARAHLEDTSLKLMTDGFEWPTSMSSLYDEFDDEDVEEEEEEEDEDTGGGSSARRSLFWRQIVRYYISYGALAANRIPCPPRSGRSYYTHNCFKARGPVHPYTRGCNRITRCRR